MSLFRKTNDSEPEKNCTVYSLNSERFLWDQQNPSGIAPNTALEQLRELNNLLKGNQNQGPNMPDALTRTSASRMSLTSLFQKIHCGKCERECRMHPINRVRSQPLSATQSVDEDTWADIANNDITNDLATLIGDAITVWTQKYHLDTLPNDIILDQVLAIITAVRNSL